MRHNPHKPLTVRPEQSQRMPEPDDGIWDDPRNEKALADAQASMQHAIEDLIMDAARDLANSMGDADLFEECYERIKEGL